MVHLIHAMGGAPRIYSVQACSTDSKWRKSADFVRKNRHWGCLLNGPNRCRKVSVNPRGARLRRDLFLNAEGTEPSSGSASKPVP